MHSWSLFYLLTDARVLCIINLFVLLGLPQRAFVGQLLALDGSTHLCSSLGEGNESTQSPMQDGDAERGAAPKAKIKVSDPESHCSIL